MRKPKINQQICSAIETLDKAGLIVKELDEVSASTLYNIRTSNYMYLNYLEKTGRSLNKLNKKNKNKMMKMKLAKVPYVGKVAEAIFDRMYQ